jgi:cell division protein FtsW
MVYSSSYIFAQERTGDGFLFIKKQIFFALLGGIALLVAWRMDVRKWEKWAYLIALGSLVLLIVVLFPGVGAKAGGAQRWIRLGPLNFQPGEIAKFAMIGFASAQLARKQNEIHRFVPGVISPMILALPAIALLLKQPDFGTALMIGTSIFLLQFIAGVPKRYLLGLLGGGLAGGAALILSSPYRLSRVMTFIDPWKDPLGKGFQILQSMVGLSHGEILGVGLGNGKEKLFYLPEAHNDFIFAVIGEELGFVGVFAVVLTFLFFIYRGLRIAWIVFQERGDRFSAYLAAGITIAFGIQGMANMAVVVGLVPTKGLTLPFLSYGGSALVVDLFAIGVLLSIAKGQRVR